MHVTSGRTETQAINAIFGLEGQAYVKIIELNFIPTAVFRFFHF